MVLEVVGSSPISRPKFMIKTNPRTHIEIVSLILLAVTSVILVGLANKSFGWPFFAAAFLFHLLATRDEFRKHIGLLYVSLSLLGLIPITTDITNENFARMGLVLLSALLLPLLVTRLVFKDKSIVFRWHHGRRWLRNEVGYILGTAVGAYFFLPYYLKSTGAYLNWGVENTSESIGRLFIGTNALGFWDELFFISTVLGILRRYLPFWQANLLQAVMFTSFLFELGFTGWGPLVIYPFALSQGYIFKKTDSLLYVITIHLTLDFVLFLALLNSHHPDLADVFIN